MQAYRKRLLLGKKEIMRPKTLTLTKGNVFKVFVITQPTPPPPQHSK